MLVPPDLISLCQVVTDQAIHLAQDKRVMETVVDSTYQTKSGALNKARALQYCLEEDKSVLSGHYPMT